MRTVAHMPIDRVSGAGRRVCVLEADPDLSVGIAHDQLEHARRGAVARMMEFQRGRLYFRPPDDDGLGALILDGLVLVRVDFAGIRGNVELLGPGDVMSPWLGMAGDFAPPCTVTARVLTKLQVAWLESDFALRTGRWPAIQAGLMRRLLARSRRLSMQSAINSMPRVEERLELTLWQLAYRFGYMSGAGVKLHLPLTHTHLAEMTGARRPSVSTAITKLRSHGDIVVSTRGHWLLCGSPPPLLAGRSGGFSAVARRPREREARYVGKRADKTEVPDLAPGVLAGDRGDPLPNGSTKPNGRARPRPRPSSPRADGSAPADPRIPSWFADGSSG